MTRSAVGQAAEAQARNFLERQGLLCVASNYRCRLGEIDLVMRDGDTVVFVEVRYRGGRGFGGALASIDRHKRARLVAAAQHYLQAKAAHSAARFDVVGIDAHRRIEWIADAFPAGD